MKMIFKSLFAILRISTTVLLFVVATSADISTRLIAATKFVKDGSTSSSSSIAVFTTSYRPTIPPPFHSFYQVEQMKVTQLANNRNNARRDRLAAFLIVSENQVELATIGLASSRHDNGVVQTAATSTTTDKKTKKKTSSSSSSQSSKTEDWCGTFTSIAAAAHPHQFYPNHSSNRSAVVLITGIFSHPLGVHLATVLQKECPNISTIIGMDPLLPANISQRRIRMVEERMKLMYKQKHATSTNFIFVPTPFVGLAPRQYYYADADDTTTANNNKDWDLVTLYQPTHIVHLLSYQEDHFLKTIDNNNKEGEEFSSTFFQIHQSRTAMEQILTSIYKAHVRGGDTIVPHLVYASSLSSLHSTTALIDELLVSTYATLLNLTSPMIGLRFSSIYGPTGSFGSDIHDMASNAVVGPQIPILMPPNSYIDDAKTLTSSSSSKENAEWWRMLLDNDNKTTVDLIHAEDAAQAVITAMQFYPSLSNTAIFHVASGSRTSLLSVALLMEQELPRRGKYSLEHFMNDTIFNLEKEDAKSNHNPNNNSERIIEKLQRLYLVTNDVRDATGAAREEEVSLLLHTKEHLGWQPRISIQDGISQTLNWYFLRRHKHGPTMQDVSAHARRHPSSLLLEHWISFPTVPCTSECALSNMCAATDTLWNDEVLELVRKVTNGYEVVFYIVNLDVLIIEEDMADSAASSDSDDEAFLCKVAFVQKDSDLVQSYFRNKTKTTHKNDVVGTFKHGEFHIIWMAAPRAGIAQADLYYAKMAPGGLFPESVLYAFFMDFYLGSYPSTSDILGMTTWMKTWETDQRTKNVGTIPNRKTYIIPARPARRAAILIQTAVLYDENDKVVNNIDPDILKFLNHVMLGLDVTQDTLQRRAQMQFYDSIYHLFASEEFRDSSEFDPRHFNVPPIYTALVIHDLELEEGRQLRCDWYKEHLFWNGSELEDRSLTYVLSQRAWAERHGLALKEGADLPSYLADDSWIPILRPLSNLTQARYHYPYALRSKSISGSRMYFNQVRDSNHDGLYVKLFGQSLSKFVTEDMYKAAADLSMTNKPEGSIVSNNAAIHDSSSDASPRIVDTNEEGTGKGDTIVSDSGTFIDAGRNIQGKTGNDDATEEEQLDAQ